MSKPLYLKSRWRVRWYVWWTGRAWIPRRLHSGVSVRRYKFWRWLHRDWFCRYMESQETYEARRRHYEEWKAARAAEATE